MPQEGPQLLLRSKQVFLGLLVSHCAVSFKWQGLAAGMGGMWG